MSIRRIVIPEVSQIVIPEMQPINIPTYIPTTSSSLHLPLPSLDLPGCVLSHRDASLKNTQIIFDDPNGSYWSCPEGQLPSYTPIDYNPKTLEIVEESEPAPISTPAPPDAITPEIPDKPEEEAIIQLEPCPGPNDQRVGDFRNEKRLERVIGHKRGDDLIECVTLYEDVPFIDQYIPEASVIVSTAIIGLVAASSPIILNIIKPTIKNIVKKLTKKKDKVE